MTQNISVQHSTALQGQGAVFSRHHINEIVNKRQRRQTALTSRLLSNLQITSLAIDSHMPNLVFPVPYRKAPRPKPNALVRHPINQRLYRRL